MPPAKKSPATKKAASKKPTKAQLENAIAAGWDPDDGVPPGGWDAHGKDPGPVEELEGPHD